MIRSIKYHGWEAMALETAEVRVVVPVDVGPRVIACERVADGRNLFATLPEQLGRSGEADWCIRGGHRLWHAPEKPGRTYVPDNVKVAVEATGPDCLCVKGGIENGSAMEKTLSLEMVDRRTIRVTHRLRSHGEWPVTCAAWALSVMAHGGYAVVPLPPKVPHTESLLPGYHMVPWAYTDFSLPVWDFHRDFIGLDVASSRVPQKLGLGSYPGWSAYWQEAGLFVKFSKPLAGAIYPDLGCSFETFCNDWMIELETLSPLVTLDTGEAIDHVEYWGIFGGLPCPRTDEDFRAKLLPTVEAWLSELPA